MSDKSEVKDKQMPFLTEVAFFIVIMSFGIAAGLTLAVDPFCAEFNVLCDAGIFTLSAIGLGVSIALGLGAALVCYLASLIWKNDDQFEKTHR